MIAVVDCDNFFVSCERVFRPDLWQLPVVVLSNNDGCVIARSKEVKRAGIKMGAPYFQCKNILSSIGAVTFSANFELYGDVSKRVRAILDALGLTVEHYSIDESFIKLEQDSAASYRAWAEALRQTIWQWVGVPVSIGIGQTKTLAKAAVWKAKNNGEGSFIINDRQSAVSTLSTMPVGEVWGIGWRFTPKLLSLGIKTAYDLSISDRAVKLFNKTGLATLQELQGFSCIKLEDIVANQHSLAVTRSFGEDINNFDELKASLSYFARCVAERLRAKKLRASRILVFVAQKTSSGAKRKYEYRKVVITLPFPTNDTIVIAGGAITACRLLFSTASIYKKAGVTAVDLSDQSISQLTIEDSSVLDRRLKQEAMFHSIDKLKSKNSKLLLGSEANSNGGWKSKQKNISSSSLKLNKLPRVLSLDN